MQRRTLIVLCVLAIVGTLFALTNQAAHADQLQWGTSQDTYADESRPNATPEAEVNVVASNQTGARKRIYLKFAVAGIPANAGNLTTDIILRARDTNPSSTFTVHADACSWQSSKLTWRNAPAPGAAQGSVTAATTAGQDLVIPAGAYVAGDGTKCVQVVTTATADRRFVAGNDPAGPRPQLRVTYSLPTTTTQAATTTSTTEAPTTTTEPPTTTTEAPTTTQAPTTTTPPTTLPGQVAYYVSPAGSDANPGTEAAPFATLAKARDVVRTQTAGMTGDITVYLRGGTHTLTSPLALTAADSGANGFSVIWSAYPGERPIVSGGQRITGWTQYDATKNLWRANVGTGLATRQLYINGVRGLRARSTLNPTGFTRTTSGWTTTDTSMASWRNIADMEMTGFKNWKHFYCGVASISGTAIAMQEPCWTRTQGGSWPFDKIAYVENAYELTDQPGEWYYDRPAGYLYYIPRSGEDLATAEVVAPKLEKIIDGQGTTAAPVHHIQFYGLTFAYATWLFPSSDEGYNPSQTGVLKLANGGRLITPGNIHFTAGRNLRFERNLFMHLGGVALNLEKASQNDVIIANKFDDIASGGIYLGNIDDQGQTNTNAQNRFLTVQDNFITKTGADYYDVSALWAGYIDTLVGQHNEMFDISHSPVSFGWGWGTTSYAKNNDVGYNWLHKFTQILFDSAGVYTLSAQPGSQIHHNYIDQAINRYGCLYPDEGSAYMNWHHNVCSRVYQWLHLWTTSIHDNLVQYNFSDTTSQENNGTNNTVNNNTFITNGVWPAEAQAIMAGAGLEPAYADVKTISFPAS